MNVIKGLMMKDLFNLKSYTKTLIYFIVLFGFIGFFNTPYLLIIFPLTCGMTALSSFSYDGLSKSELYVQTFPITKKEMVKARYLFVLLLTILGVILGLVLAIVLTLINSKLSLNIVELLQISIGSLFGIVFLQAFQMPIIYKVGYEKARIIQMVGIMVLMVAISSITAIAIKLSPFSLEDFINMLANYGIAIIAAVILVSYFISYKLSVKIYSKKEI